jgi:hypothetical protein
MLSFFLIAWNESMKVKKLKTFGVLYILNLKGSKNGFAKGRLENDEGNKDVAERVYSYRSYSDHCSCEHSSPQ